MNGNIVKVSTQVTLKFGGEQIEQRSGKESVFADIGNLKLRLHKMTYDLDEMKIISKNCSLHLDYIDKFNKKTVLKKVNPTVIPTLCGTGHRAAKYLR